MRKKWLLYAISLVIIAGLAYYLEPKWMELPVKLQKQVYGGSITGVFTGILMGLISKTHMKVITGVFIGVIASVVIVFADGMFGGCSLLICYFIVFALFTLSKKP